MKLAPCQNGNTRVATIYIFGEHIQTISKKNDEQAETTSLKIITGVKLEENNKNVKQSLLGQKCRA